LFILSVFTGYENDAGVLFLLIQQQQDSAHIESAHAKRSEVDCFSYLGLPCHKQSTYYSLPAYRTISPFKRSTGPAELPSCLLNSLAQACLPCASKIYLFQHGS